MRVIVIGAGLAGLAAADALRRAGAEVLVLEARERVGGRVWSRELRDGVILELGAEFVLPGNEVLTGLVERFSLGLWDKGMLYGDRRPQGGIGVTREVLVEAARTVREALARAAPDVTALAFLESLELDPGAREAIIARAEVTSATTADRFAAAALEGIVGHAEEVCPSVAGGNGRLALALAEELGDTVLLGCPVERVDWRGGRVSVLAAGVRHRAESAVLAAPASVAGRIDFEPPLPERVVEAYGGVEYGHAAKLFVPLRGETPPPGAVLSVPERYWTWTATGAGGEVQPVVHAFAGSAPALAALQVDEGPGAWVESLARLRPELSLDPVGAVLSTWDDDPWVGAAYSTHAPSPAPESAWAPVGPIHFCGEHTAGEWAATMEGALRSGQRAAAEIVGRS